MDRKSYKQGFKDALEILKYIRESKQISWDEAWKLLYTAVAEDTIKDLLRELGL